MWMKTKYTAVTFGLHFHLPPLMERKRRHYIFLYSLTVGTTVLCRLIWLSKLKKREWNTAMQFHYSLQWASIWWIQLGAATQSDRPAGRSSVSRVVRCARGPSQRFNSGGQTFPASPSLPRSVLQRVGPTCYYQSTIEMGWAHLPTAYTASAAGVVWCGVV